MKRKVLFGIIIIFLLILIIVSIMYRINAFNEYAEVENAIIAERTEEIMEDELKDINNFNKMFIYSLLENENIKEAFFNRDREKLIELTLPLYEKISGNVAQFHFILPDYTSFLRVHAIDDYGDNNEYRLLLREVNEKRIIVSGIEKGKYGFGLRTVAPVYYNGIYIGTVESGINLDDILLKHYKDVDCTDVYIYSINEEKSELVAGVTRNDTWSKLSDEELDIIKNKNNVIIILSEEEKKIVAMPILNYGGDVIGYTKIIYSNVLEYERRKNIDYWNIALIILFCSFILTLIIDYFYRRKKKKEMDDNIDGIIQAITMLIASRDSITGEHVVKAQRYVQVIVNELEKINNVNYKISSKLKEEIMSAALLHDIGKVSIPDSILFKKGKLTKEEMLIMQKHTTISTRDKSILKGFKKYSFVETLEDIIHYHHERWDGKGYPNGLSGEDIPLCARIMALADSYDAITSHRVYQEARTHDEAVKIIKEERGFQFDPVIVGLFLKNGDKFEKILNDDE